MYVSAVEVNTSQTKGQIIDRSTKMPIKFWKRSIPIIIPLPSKLLDTSFNYNRNIFVTFLPIRTMTHSFAEQICFGPEIFPKRRRNFIVIIVMIVQNKHSTTVCTRWYNKMAPSRTISIYIFRQFEWNGFWMEWNNAIDTVKHKIKA